MTATNHCLFDGRDARLLEWYSRNQDLTFLFCAYAVTLYLILFVEFARHTIDSAARGRPFFTAVLKMVYSECKKVWLVG